MQHFTHAGDLGDVIYSLPAVKAMGGGTLWLSDPKKLTMHGMTRERFDSIAPLLRAQPYIDAVHFASPDVDAIDLNAFRYDRRDLATEWLPNHYLDVLGLDRELATKDAWLTAEAVGCPTGVVIARSARYHNPHFPWRTVLEHYADHAVFIGTPAEHVAFNTEFDADLPHVLTRDLAEVASVLMSCMLFVGNQSCPLAIAEGLKVPIVCECCPYCPNCISQRPRFLPVFYGDIGPFLPDVEVLSNALRERSPAAVLSREQGQTAKAGRQRQRVG